MEVIWKKRGLGLWRQAFGFDFLTGSETLVVRPRTDRTRRIPSEDWWQLPPFADARNYGLYDMVF